MPRTFLQQLLVHTHSPRPAGPPGPVGAVGAGVGQGGHSLSQGDTIGA